VAPEDQASSRTSGEGGTRRLPPILRAPVFLVGAERSGSTMLRLMLDHHPQLAWLNEFEYCVDLMGDDGSFPDLETYREWLATHRIFQASGLDAGEATDFPSLVEGFLIQKRDRDSKSLVGATVHRAFHRLLFLWQDARFVHLVRDPRDVAPSVVAMGWAGNVWAGVEAWLTAEIHWEALRSRLGPGRSIEVRYEDLVRRPAEELRRICDLIGVPFREEMLGYVRSSTYDTPDPGRASRWETKLTRRQIQLVESRVGRLLQRRGYRLSGLPALRVGPVLATLLRLQNRWGRMTFRMRRYGLPLWAQDVFSRRFGSRKRRRKVLLRLNRVDEAHLK